MRSVQIKLKSANSEKRYEMFLQMLSGMLIPKLTDREIDVLVASKVETDGDFSTDSRRKIQQRMQITEYTLNNYIKALRDKKVVEGNQIAKTFNIDTGNSEEPFVIYIIDNLQE
jgi:DNA-binding CsgD family transcriptional regulator